MTTVLPTEKNIVIQKSFDKLSSHLEDLTKNYRLLLDCVRKEKELLISTDVENLNENNLLKEQLLFKIKSLDGLRVNYATELSMALGLDTQKIRLLEIAQKIGGAQADKLRTYHSALEMIIKRLTDLNQSNAALAQSALKTVNSAMNSFKDTLMGQKTYQKKGQYKQGSEKSGHLVRTEA
jgi:flagellar biosynthesis/type III secretory pathway chaperone